MVADETGCRGRELRKGGDFLGIGAVTYALSLGLMPGVLVGDMTWSSGSSCAGVTGRMASRVNAFRWGSGVVLCPRGGRERRPAVGVPMAEFDRVDGHEAPETEEVLARRELTGILERVCRRWELLSVDFGLDAGVGNAMRLLMDSPLTSAGMVGSPANSLIVLRCGLRYMAEAGSRSGAPGPSGGDGRRYHASGEEGESSRSDRLRRWRVGVGKLELPSEPRRRYEGMP